MQGYQYVTYTGQVILPFPIIFLKNYLDLISFMTFI
jgi:hypothetical protein